MRDSCELYCGGEQAVPEDSAAQAFVEVHLGVVPECGAGQRNVSQRVGDASRARGCVLYRASTTGEFAETVDCAVKRDALFGCNVEDAA